MPASGPQLDNRRVLAGILDLMVVKSVQPVSAIDVVMEEDPKGAA